MRLVWWLERWLCTDCLAELYDLIKEHPEEGELGRWLRTDCLSELDDLMNTHPEEGKP